jgi:hypothetical protein
MPLWGNDNLILKPWIDMNDAATRHSTFLCSMPRLFNGIYIQSSHVQWFPMLNGSYVQCFLCSTPKQRWLLFKAKMSPYMWPILSLVLLNAWRCTSNRYGMNHKDRKLNSSKFVIELMCTDYKLTLKPLN